MLKTLTLDKRTLCYRQQKLPISDFFMRKKVLLIKYQKIEDVEEIPWKKSFEH